MAAAIEVKKMSFTYPNGFEALKDIDFSIGENEFVAIIGQNGAGKSTLLKNLTGLLKPTTGEVLVGGTSTKEISVAKLSTKLGFVLQNPDRQLFADTVLEEIAFGPQNLGLEKAEVDARVEDAIKMTGLEKHREAFPPALSAGERAKVVIASVVAMRPGIIILDEPTTGQDNRGCHQIMNIAKAFHGMGHTVVMVTHNMALVTEYAKRTIVFCAGGVLLDGSTGEVFSQPEALKKSYILPPQITRMGMSMAERLGTKDVFFNVDDFAAHLTENSLLAGKGTTKRALKEAVCE